MKKWMKAIAGGVAVLSLAFPCALTAQAIETADSQPMPSQSTAQASTEVDGDTESDSSATPHTENTAHPEPDSQSSATESAAPAEPSDSVAAQADADPATNGPWGTCQWSIDDAGILLIQPTDSSAANCTTVETGNGSQPGAQGQMYGIVPWYNWYDKITAVKTAANKQIILGSTDNMGSQKGQYSYLFQNCRHLRDIQGLSQWVVGDNVIGFWRAFDGCSQLSDFSPIAGWRPKLTIVAGMFRNSGITNLDALAGWNVAAVTDYTNNGKLGMFAGCANLTDASAMKDWTFHSSAQFKNMFDGCIKLSTVGIPPGSWNNNKGGRALLNKQSVVESGLTAVMPEVKSIEGITPPIGPLSWEDLAGRTDGNPSLLDNPTVWTSAAQWTIVLHANTGATASPTQTITQSLSESYTLPYALKDVQGFDKPGNFIYGWTTAAGTGTVDPFAPPQGLRLPGTALTADSADANKTIDVYAQWAPLWGTCPWWLYSDGTLHIGAGTGSNTARPWNDTAEHAAKVKAVTVDAPDANGPVVHFPQNANTLFRNCTNLENIDGLANVDVQEVQYMTSMFEGCTNLASLQALSSWNVNKVLHMTSMFSGCSKLVNLQGLGQWNTAQVTDMASMFAGCSSLTSLTALKAEQGHWNVGAVTTMSAMFKDCVSLQNLEGLEQWHAVSATSMASMFQGCSSLQSLGALTNWLRVSYWNGKRVEDMSNMFQGCRSLTTLKGTEYWDLSTVKTTQAMFQNCTALNSLAAWKNSSWKAANIIVNAQSMFSGCTSLTSLEGLENLKVNNTIATMFEGCTHLANAAVLATWDLSTQGLTGNVIFNGIFSNCTALRYMGIPSLNKGGKKFVKNASAASFGIIMPRVMQVDAQTLQPMANGLGPLTWGEMVTDMGANPTSYASGTVWTPYTAITDMPETGSTSLLLYAGALVLAVLVVGASLASVKRN